MLQRRWESLVLSTAVAVSTIASQIVCPLQVVRAHSGGRGGTLAMQVEDADVIVLAECVADPKGGENQRATAYQIKQIVRRCQDRLKVGQKISVRDHSDNKPGDLFLVMGTQASSDGDVHWKPPVPVSETSFDYIINAPSTNVTTRKRLEYYVNYLESSDKLVASDAYAEFADAPFEDILFFGKKLPREKVRQWVTSTETPANRLGLYGLLIGLCGNQDDAKVIEAKLQEKTQDFGLGIDGLMSGYLLLTREKGLAVIDAKLRNKDVPFSETYGAMQAIRFMWQYGEGKIEPERLRQSMRILLERPELADFPINDLVRWKDWSIQDQLMTMYGEGEFDIPSIKRAIVRYMLVSSKDLPKGTAGEAGGKVPDHVKRGRVNVEVLRQRDPTTVRDAEQFLFRKE